MDVVQKSLGRHPINGINYSPTMIDMLVNILLINLHFYTNVVDVDTLPIKLKRKLNQLEPVAKVHVTKCFYAY